MEEKLRRKETSVTDPIKIREVFDRFGYTIKDDRVYYVYFNRFDRSQNLYFDSNNMRVCPYSILEFKECLKNGSVSNSFLGNGRYVSVNINLVSKINLSDLLIYLDDVYILDIEFKKGVSDNDFRKEIGLWRRKQVL